MKLLSKARKSTSGRGIIMLLTGLLFMSAAIRLGVGASEAWASTTQDKQATTDEAAINATDLADVNVSRSGLAAMLKAFEEREQRLDERELQIDLRLKALSVADQEIERRMTDLKDTEEALRGTLALADSAAETDLAKLTSVYEAMKPKTAAALFEQMEPAFAAGFVGRMRPEFAAGVMAALSPQAAYSVSVILASRNSSVPKG